MVKGRQIGGVALGEPDLDACASLRAVANRRAAAPATGQHLHDREPEACSRRRRAGAAAGEALEEHVLLARRDPRALVLDGEPDLVSGRPPAQCDWGSW